MKNSFTPKILLFFTALLFSVWFGSYITREVMVYQLFEPVNLDLKSIYNTQNLVAVTTILLPAILTNIVTFPIFLLAFIAYILFSKINIKKEGWLFIILILVLITAPFELYLLSFIDLKIVQLITHSPSNLSEIIPLVRKRITELSSFTLIEIFSYIGIIFLVIFKPLRKHEN